MLIPDDIRKCVVFIGLRLADGTYNLRGTGFLLGRDENDPKHGLTYLVTARHVIDRIKKTGVDQVWLRLNRKDGTSSWESTSLTSWFVHPSDSSIDVSVFAVTMSAEFDHLVFPYSSGVKDDILLEGEIGLGDEVFIVGLFRHHHGNRRNIPIVRVGNLAALGEEKVVTNLGEMDAFFIEARSIGGLSGSPVFLNLGAWRQNEGQMRMTIGPQQLLLGIVHGHFETSHTNVEDEVSENSKKQDQVNVGIAIVVPFEKICQVIAGYESANDAELSV